MSNIRGQAAGQTISMLGGYAGANWQNQQERDMLALQHQNQMALNRQGAGLQYDMWKKTSFPAQLEMLRKAGLSPGLMYKQGGTPGSTGSQTGGAAAKGNAAQFRVMDMSAMKLGAEIELLKAEAEKSKAIANKTGQETTNLKESFKEIGARIKELGSQNLLNIANEELTKANVNVSKKQLDEIDARISKINVEADQIQKITDLDYSGVYGRNLSENLNKALGLTPDATGKLGLDDAVIIGTTVGGLGILKSPRVVGNLSKEARTKLVKSVTSLTGKILAWWRGKGSKVVYSK